MSTKPTGQTGEEFYAFEVRKADGKQISLENFRQRAVLVVNVASKCGFTPQYTELEKLHTKYKDRGFTVLGFPCNQFGGQEPGSDSEIQEFCQLNFGVTFPVLGKVDVNGTEAAPVYRWLKSSAPGLLGTEAIKWNFTKFLIGQDGKVISRYAPTTKPEEIAGDIEKALA